MLHFMPEDSIRVGFVGDDKMKLLLNQDSNAYANMNGSIKYQLLKLNPRSEKDRR